MPVKRPHRRAKSARPMKALSIKEPYISRIISGEKTVEFRSWPTKHRGDLLLCGSASPKGEYAGVAACVVEIAGVVDFNDGTYGWILENVRPLKQPFHVKGKLGLYEVNQDVGPLKRKIKQVRYYDDDGYLILEG